METNTMDRKIEKKKGIARAFTKKALPFWGGALLLAFILWLIFRDDSQKLRIDADNITVSTVTQGEFNDYIRISGQVAPMTTIQISPLEGGVVQQIVAEEGSRVSTGDVILILSNENLDMQILNSEADLAEKENILRNTMIQMEQQKLSVEQEKLHHLQLPEPRHHRLVQDQDGDEGRLKRIPLEAHAAQPHDHSDHYGGLIWQEAGKPLNHRMIRRSSASSITSATF